MRLEETLLRLIQKPAGIYCITPRGASFKRRPAQNSLIGWEGKGYANWVKSHTAEKEHKLRNRKNKIMPWTIVKEAAAKRVASVKGDRHTIFL